MSVPPSPDDIRDSDIRDSDIRDSETIVVGALLAALETAMAQMPGATLELPTGATELPWNAVWLNLDFMKSRYRVTVTWDPSPDDPRPDEPTPEETRQAAYDEAEAAEVWGTT